MARVLIIDDDPTFGQRAVRCLEKAGMRARFHEGPFGSLHAVRETGCEIVLVDVDMPRLDGGLLVKMIRDAFGLGQTRIMLVGDRSDPELADLAVSVGAHGYASKGLTDAELAGRVAGLAQRRTSRRPTPAMG
ncbi:response regulator [Polyangium mundeleinium]|uniref:Response regulator n=1 Tax=Polyangium mundeleinium TaxID=2995306 RepID=A0ABT5EYU1_9BACT|nr:response regulator [Polyangium mundeleinium]MDC0746559.1 response regulator [Polyangium mundeleinium]